MSQYSGMLDEFCIFSEKDPIHNRIYVEMKAAIKEEEKEHTKYIIHVFNNYTPPEEKKLFITNLNSISEEQQTMKSNIIKIYKVSDHGTYKSNAGSTLDNVCYVAYEMPENYSSLHEVIKKNKAKIYDKVNPFISQLLEVVKEMISHRINHNDIRPRNLFVDQSMDNVYVGGWDFAAHGLEKDFCLLRKKYESEENGITQCFLPPEFNSLELKSSPMHFDIFSVGVVIYLLKNSILPFKNSTDASFNTFINEKASGNHVDQLIKDILKRDPFARKLSDELMETYSKTLSQKPSQFSMPN